VGNLNMRATGGGDEAGILTPHQRHVDRTSGGADISPPAACRTLISLFLVVEGVYERFSSHVFACRAYRRRCATRKYAADENIIWTRMWRQQLFDAPRSARRCAYNRAAVRV